MGLFAVHQVQSSPARHLSIWDDVVRVKRLAAEPEGTNKGTEEQEKMKIDCEAEKDLESICKV